MLNDKNIDNLWIIGAKNTYESKKIYNEFKKRGILSYRINWDEITLPFINIPKVAVIRYSKKMREKQSIAFVLSVLEELKRNDCNLIPSLEGIYKVDKASIYLLWKKFLEKEINMPESIITKNLEIAKKFLEKEKCLIFKPLVGGLGRNVKIIREYKELKELYDEFQVLFLQKFIENPGYDIRTIVIGDKIIINYIRYNPEDFRHNIHAGGKAIGIEEARYIDKRIDIYIKKIDSIYKKIKYIANLDCLGIDFMPSKRGKLYLLEWNAVFGFAGAESATGINIASIFVDYIIKKYLIKNKNKI